MGGIVVLGSGVRYNSQTFEMQCEGKRRKADGA